MQGQENARNPKPPNAWLPFSIIDAHAAGEPLRVVVRGLPEIPGETITEKLRYFRGHFDHLRGGLTWEPPGHADMYCAVLTPPVTSDGDLGVLFLQTRGYSSMCGHAIIALTKVVLDTGIVDREGDDPVLKLDTPVGRVVAVGHRARGRVATVSFTNVPSFVYLAGAEVAVPGIGPVAYDIAFGGAYYAICDATQLDLEITRAEYPRLIETGMAIKRAIAAEVTIESPCAADFGFLHGTILVGPPANQYHHSRNVCIFGDGELDRSPTGAGVSARAALHHSRNELAVGEIVTIESVIGTSFDLRIREKVAFADHDAIVPEVTGNASIVGHGELCFDPTDPLRHGFLLR
ncbi:MAG: proline racemase family protein [bacterium]|nr:proline racemase family protein [bacterium]